jgi:hypothetical protein
MANPVDEVVRSVEASGKDGFDFDFHFWQVKRH